MRKIHHPSKEEIELSQVLYALGDPARLAIVANLANQTGSCRDACDKNLSKSTLSHHFKILREAGIVYSEKDGACYVNTLRTRDLNDRFPGLLASVLRSSRRASRARSASSRGRT